MGVDFRQQALSRITCRTSTASDMPCGRFELSGGNCMLWRGWLPTGAMGQGAKVVQDRAVRLVRVRAAPQRSVSVRLRAPAVHGRRPFVHGLLREGCVDALHRRHVGVAAAVDCRGGADRSDLWDCGGGAKGSGVGRRFLTISRADCKTAGVVGAGRHVVWRSLLRLQQAREINRSAQTDRPDATTRRCRLAD